MPIAAVAMAQCPRRVDDFDRMSTAFEAGDVLGQPIRLVRVVDADRAVGARERVQCPMRKYVPTNTNVPPRGNLSVISRMRSIGTSANAGDGANSVQIRTSACRRKRRHVSMVRKSPPPVGSQSGFTRCTRAAVRSDISIASLPRRRIMQWNID